MSIKCKQAHKMLIDDGWRWIRGGKGSHRKYKKKKNGKIWILPYHGNKDLPIRIEKELLKILKGK